MYPAWHGLSYYRILRSYGLKGLWNQFWYDVKNWKVLRG